jgi:ABC-type multidrug transport system fused ATPase/permease subunit
MNFRTLVFRNLKKVKKDFLLYVLSFALASVANLLPPFVTSRIVDCFKAQDKVQIINSVLFWLLFFLIATLVQAVNRYIMRIRGAVFKEKFVAFIQRDLFNVIHAHSVSYFDDEMTNSISMAADYVSGRMGFLCVNIFFDMFRPVIVLFATFLIIAYQSPLLAFVLFLISLPIFLIERFCLPKIHKLMTLRGKAERIYTGFFGDSLANFKLVRYLGSFFTEHLKGYALLKNYLRTTYRAENKRNFYIVLAW